MKTPLLGFASGFAAGDAGCGYGPLFLHEHIEKLQGLDYYWHSIFYSKPYLADKYICVADICKQLAKTTYLLTRKNQPFVTIGGDHSSAMGTWFGVAQAKMLSGDIGLIWIDAHMDSHTPETTPSGNIHGMPLAALLGYGDKRLTHLLMGAPHIKPENVCLIGIRSYEQSEIDLLESLGVRLYFMNEIKARGLKRILLEAVRQVTQRTVGYGLSIDLDSIDANQVRGVGTPVYDGIEANSLIESLAIFEQHPPIAAEIAEYNPYRDPEFNTLNILVKILEKLNRSFNPSGQWYESNEQKKKVAAF